MVEERAQRRLAAILAADVVGYSRLMEQNEAGTFERLRVCRKELIEPEIAQHHGRVFKPMGDGLLAEFASVVETVECAAVVQRNTRDHQPIHRSSIVVLPFTNLGTDPEQDYFADVIINDLNFASFVEKRHQARPVQ
jgi:hypothetical protein